MSTSNGAVRIGVASTATDAIEAAAIVAAVERFLVETAPSREAAQPPSAWQWAALEEGIAARQVDGRSWGVRISSRNPMQPQGR